ncbi:hypothetical protein P692DRAFT_20824989 [Suillus brevipes Sb2]|nr:hypothetical protein P692DRAFT_20824989 [Suillus brevipes Sb2]
MELGERYIVVQRASVGSKPEILQPTTSMLVTCAFLGQEDIEMGSWRTWPADRH